MKFIDQFDDQDLKITRGQLNQRETQILGVFHRCQANFPVAVCLDPIKKKSLASIDLEEKINRVSFVNPIWLTCPFLNEIIHSLESDNLIKEIESFINSNPFCKDLMEQSHLDYYYFRKQLVKSRITKAERLKLDYWSGIGGLKNFTAIKCLHLHYAHYLAGQNNLVGRMVESLLGDEKSCQSRECQKFI